MSEIYMYMCCKVLLDHIWPSSSNTLWNKQIINNQTGWRNGLDINVGFRSVYTLMVDHMLYLTQNK